jgi:hypothetical protein
MIVVRVELHSAITRQVTELARMKICNVGGSQTLGDYSVETLRGRSREQLDRGQVQRRAFVKRYPRLALHVWHLVARALVASGYAGAREQAETQEGFL